jgi:hypothetical protein
MILLSISQNTYLGNTFDMSILYRKTSLTTLYYRQYIEQMNKIIFNKVFISLLSLSSGTEL